MDRNIEQDLKTRLQGIWLMAEGIKSLYGPEIDPLLEELSDINQSPDLGQSKELLVARLDVIKALVNELY